MPILAIDWFGCVDSFELLIGLGAIAILFFSAGFGTAKADALVRDVLARLKGRPRKESKS